MTLMIRSARRLMARAWPLFFLAVFFMASPSWAQTTTQDDEAQKAAATRFPRGKKLMLKDGGFQVVSEYEIKGDRVRYWSLERGAWEEIPKDMVDWEKTKKAEERDKKQDDALVEKAKKLEDGQKPMPLDIDASYPVAPGVFLPDGEGLFALNGKTVTPLVQAEMDSKLDKGKALAKIMLPIPVPIVPTTHNISLPGAHAAFRSPDGQLEFYLRLKDVTNEPNLELLRAVVREKNRRIEKIDEWFGGQEKQMKKDAVAIQLWPVAPGLWRVTLREQLTPGEYVMAWILRGDKLNVIFWDFGIGPADAPNPASKQKKKKK